MRAVTVALLLVAATRPLRAQDTTAVRAVNDSILVRFVDTDLRGVIQALGRYLPKPVLVGNIQPARVSLETPAPVPRLGLRGLLKGLVESQGLDFTEDSAFFRISTAPSRALPPGGTGGGAGLPPGAAGQGGGAAVQLFVVRLKHARAADVAATVNLLFGGGGEFSGRAGLSTPTLSDELRRNVVPPAGAAPPAAGGTTLRRSSSDRVGVDSPARPENSPPPPNSRFTVAATSAARACLRRTTNSWTAAPPPCPAAPGGSPAPPPVPPGGRAREGAVEIRKNAESSVKSRPCDSTKPLSSPRSPRRGTGAGVSSETRAGWMLPTSTGLGR